jgi:hypothetical protein
MTTEDIRGILFKQMIDLQDKKITHQEAKAMADLSAQAIYTTRLELENKRMELELGKADEEVKKWMNRDFSNIQNIKG